MVAVASDRAVQRPLREQVSQTPKILGKQPKKQSMRTGQICAFAVNSTVTPLMMKNRLCRLANCAGVSASSPVLSSNTPPVAAAYRLNASVVRTRSLANCTERDVGVGGLTGLQERQRRAGVDDPR